MLRGAQLRVHTIFTQKKIEDFFAKNFESLMGGCFQKCSKLVDFESGPNRWLDFDETWNIYSSHRKLEFDKKKC